MISSSASTSSKPLSGSTEEIGAIGTTGVTGATALCVSEEVGVGAGAEDVGAGAEGAGAEGAGAEGAGAEEEVDVSDTGVGVTTDVVLSDVTVGVSTRGAGVCTGQIIVRDPGCRIPPPFTS